MLLGFDVADDKLGCINFYVRGNRVRFYLLGILRCAHILVIL